MLCNLVLKINFFIIDSNPYSNIIVNSKFHDIDSLCANFRNSNSPLFISFNVQSLSSKFDKLCSVINILCSNNVPVDVIALQETWQVKHHNLFNIPGFQPLICSNRIVGKGGGVGFYVRDVINCKIVDTRVSFTDKIFESLTLKLSYSEGKNVVVSNIYRSPTPINGIPTDVNLQILMTVLIPCLMSYHA
jgi:hypothetical protein